MARLLKDRKVQAFLTALIAAGGIFAVTFSVNVGEDGATLTFTVNQKQDRPPGAAAEGVKPTEVTVSEEAVERTEDSADLQENLRDETQPNTPRLQIDAVEEKQEQLQRTDPQPLTGPLATPQFPGCRTLFVRNHSSRNGVAPQTFDVHYTAGLGTVESLAAYFDRTSTQASSHFVHDRNGRCGYLVALSDKSWTAGARNPFAISTEVINTGSQFPFMTRAGYRSLGRTIARVNHIYPRIKIRRARYRGCVPTRSGIATHWTGAIGSRLQPCNGAHYDIRTGSAQRSGVPSPFSLRPIIKAARRASCNYRAKKARASCRRWVARHG